MPNCWEATPAMRVAARRKDFLIVLVRGRDDRNVHMAIGSNAFAYL